MSMSCFDCHDYMDGFNRGKKEGTIEELEMIKAKISMTNGCGDFIATSDVETLINKRISELKGERK